MKKRGIDKGVCLTFVTNHELQLPGEGLSADNLQFNNIANRGKDVTSNHGRTTAAAHAEVSRIGAFLDYGESRTRTWIGQS